jgi:hypothetical protein
VTPCRLVQFTEDRAVSTFRVSRTSKHIIHDSACCSLSRLTLQPWRWRNTFLPNVDNLLPDCISHSPSRITETSRRPTVFCTECSNIYFKCCTKSRDWIVSIRRKHPGWGFFVVSPVPTGKFRDKSQSRRRSLPSTFKL